MEVLSASKSPRSCGLGGKNSVSFRERPESLKHISAGWQRCFQLLLCPVRARGPALPVHGGAALQLCPPRTGRHRSTLLKLTVTSWTGRSPVCDKPDETPRGATVLSVSPSALCSVLTGLHGAVQLPCFLSPGCRPLRVGTSGREGRTGC